MDQYQQRKDVMEYLNQVREEQLEMKKQGADDREIIEHAIEARQTLDGILEERRRTLHKI